MVLSGFANQLMATNIPALDIQIPFSSSQESSFFYILKNFYSPIKRPNGEYDLYRGVDFKVPADTKLLVPIEGYVFQIKEKDKLSLGYMDPLTNRIFFLNFFNLKNLEMDPGFKNKWFMGDFVKKGELIGYLRQKNEKINSFKENKTYPESFVNISISAHGQRAFGTNFYLNNPLKIFKIEDKLPPIIENVYFIDKAQGSVFTSSNYLNKIVVRGKVNIVSSIFDKSSSFKMIGNLYEGSSNYISYFKLGIKSLQIEITQPKTCEVIFKRSFDYNRVLNNPILGPILSQLNLGNNRFLSTNDDLFNRKTLYSLTYSNNKDDYWNTLSVSNGYYIVSILAKDENGNSATKNIEVIVNN